MTPEQDERLVRAFETLSGSVTSIAKTLELDYQRKYPPKREPKDVDVTYLKSEEEQLRESQGDTGEGKTEDWLSLGPRERAFAEKEAGYKGAAAPKNSPNGTRQT